MILFKHTTKYKYIEAFDWVQAVKYIVIGSTGHVIANMVDTNGISAAEEKNFFDFSDLVPVEENVDKIRCEEIAAYKRSKFHRGGDDDFTEAASFISISTEM